MVKTSNLIRTNDFCEVVTDKFEDQGYAKGSYVFVAGSKAIPEDKDDLYTQRIKFFVHMLRDNKHVDVESGLFLMDPRSLKKLPKAKQRKLSNILEKDFSPEVDEDATIN